MITHKPVTSQKTWEKFVLTSDQVNFLQSWHWGQFYQKFGHQIIRLGFYQQNKLVGVALLIKNKAKRGSYLECPGGPIIDYQNQKTVKKVLNLLKLTAQQEKVNFIRLRPNILKGVVDLTQFNLVKSPMHLHAETTWVLDLDQPEEKILKSMRKNTRYAIKKAKKLNVKVTTSKKLTDVDTLYELQLETVKRKRFIPFSKTFLKEQFETFQSVNQLQLFKASYKDQVLAMAMVHFYGQEAVYHYSGSSNQLRNIPASYLLQWKAIKTAKKLGFKRYNFWGYTENPKHRFFGPSLFKKGFGGYKLGYMPAHDLPINNSYWLTYLFETLRRKIRRL